MGSGFSFVYKDDTDVICILITSALNFCKVSYIFLKNLYWQVEHLSFWLVSQIISLRSGFGMSERITKKERKKLPLIEGCWQSVALSAP